MYSDKIVERNVAKIYDTLGISLVRYGDGNVDEMTAHLSGLVKEYDKFGVPTEWTRQPTKQEWAYINNERLFSKIDFKYFANRYAYLQIAAIEGVEPRVDRLGTVGFMRPQEVCLDKLARSEERMMDAHSRGQMVNGLRYFINKARQLHFTAISRMLSNHRTLFWPDTLAIGASVNEDMVQELYDRDKLMYSYLPWFLRPQIKFDVKNQQLSFAPLNSGTLYHQANQHGGMGMGRMIQVAHMTECAFWDDMVSAGTLMEKLDFHLFPAIPQSPTTLYILESTSNGLGGWWYDQIKQITDGKSLFELFFCPWYAADRKNRMYPPAEWVPSDFVAKMAETAERTSHAYIGIDVKLDREQLYWYEMTMAQHQGRLGVFLSNYPTTLEEAFQNFQKSAFSIETLSKLRKGVGNLWGTFDVGTAA